VILAAAAGFLAVFAARALAAPQADGPTLEKQFVEVPPEARRLTGPLFWLHGNETRERLERYVGKVAEGHNGSFCAESRPHTDGLGPTWYRDLDICLQAAKSSGLTRWIFDEKWWPSQMVGGKVPQEFASKRLARTPSRSPLAPRNPRSWRFTQGRAKKVPGSRFQVERQRQRLSPQRTRRTQRKTKPFLFKESAFAVLCARSLPAAAGVLRGSSCFFLPFNLQSSICNLQSLLSG
jgi:hypothetical protein